MGYENQPRSSSVPVVAIVLAAHLYGPGRAVGCRRGRLVLSQQQIHRAQQRLSDLKKLRWSKGSVPWRKRRLRLPESCIATTIFPGDDNWIPHHAPHDALALVHQLVELLVAVQVELLGTAERTP